MRHIATAISAAGFLLVATAGTVWAQDKAEPAADIQAGKAKAQVCADCHGLQGISKQPDVPNLSGQYTSYIRKGLLSYKQGQRRGTPMADIVASLNDQDVVNVAAYYGSLKPFDQIVKRTGPAAPPQEDPFAAVREATAECAGCHGDDGNSDIPGTPRLAGQHVSYLIDSMTQYQDGTRKEDIMPGFVESLTSADLEDIAYFYAAMEPKQATLPDEGDPIAGLAVTAPCAGCHAEDGNNEDPKTPRLAGQDAEYLVAAAEAYRAGNRNHDVMRDAISAIREAEVKDMAAYYASKEPKALPVRKPIALGDWVERCNRCHGPAGHSKDSRFPIIAGQNETYLATALKRYHVGERDNSMMFAMSFLMTESDISKLAAYYAGQGTD